MAKRKPKLSLIDRIEIFLATLRMLQNVPDGAGDPALSLSGHVLDLVCARLVEIFGVDHDAPQMVKLASIEISQARSRVNGWDVEE